MAKRWHQQSKDVDGSTKKEIYFVVKYKGSILLLYLLSTYYVPGTGLGALLALSHLILATALMR